jgi:acetyl esterase/lipase
MVGCVASGGLLLTRRIVTALAAGILGAGVASGCGSSSHTKSRPTVQSPNLPAVWGKPAGGVHRRVLLLVIHGGGWKGLDTASFDSEVATARFFQRLGYETLTFNYRGGAQSIQDAEMFYRLARKRVGPRFPICALGPSAGGHISLMLAVREPDLACVIDLAGPTDLVSLVKQRGGAEGPALAVRAFGRSNLAAYSPALHAGSIRAKVMMVYAQNDPVVPVAQGEEMARALPGSKLFVLPPGPVTFVHSLGGPRTRTGVSAAAYDRAWAAGSSFLAEVARSWHPR